jgi:hypothetical protein
MLEKGGEDQLDQSLEYWRGVKEEKKGSQLDWSHLA